MVKIISGGHTGVVKVFDVNQRKIVAEYGKDTQGINRTVLHLKWTNDNEDEALFSRKDGTLEFIQPFNYSAPEEPSDSEEPVGPAVLESDLIINRATYLKSSDMKHDIRGIFTLDVSDTRRTVYACNEKGYLDSYTIENYSDPHSRSVKLDKIDRGFSESTHVHKFVPVQIDASKVEFAYGGKDSLLKIYDLNSGKVVFRAQNEPKSDSNLQLKPPVFLRDVTYLKTQTNFGQLLCAVTGYGELQCYDRRASRLPVYKKKFEQTALNCIDSSSTVEKEVTMGSSVGGLFQYNFTDFKSTRKQYVFRGSAGSISALYYHKTSHYIASCGADRFVRLYNTADGTMESSFYLLQRQTALLMNSEEVQIPDSDDEEEENEEQATEKKIVKLTEDDPAFIPLGKNRKRKREDEEPWQEMKSYSGKKKPVHKKHKKK